MVSDCRVKGIGKKMTSTGTNPPMLCNPRRKRTYGGTIVHRRAARPLATVFIYNARSQKHREGVFEREEGADSEGINENGAELDMREKFRN